MTLDPDTRESIARVLLDLQTELRQVQHDIRTLHYQVKDLERERDAARATAGRIVGALQVIAVELRAAGRVVTNSNG